MKKFFVILGLMASLLLFFFTTTSSFEVIEVYEETVVMKYNGGETVFDKTEKDSNVKVGDHFWGWSILGSSPNPWGFDGNHSSPQ